jgi:hypothetical protein
MLKLAYYGLWTIIVSCFVRLATYDTEVEVFIYALLPEINEY